MYHKLTGIALAGLMAFVLVACGDDSGDEASSEATDETTATTQDAAAAQAEYCAIEAEVDALFNAAFSGTEPPTPEASAAVANQVLDQFADEALAAAPEEIADDVAVLLGATEEMANGDPAAFDTPEVQAAGDAVDEFCPVTP